MGRVYFDLNRYLKYMRLARLFWWTLGIFLAVALVLTILAVFAVKVRYEQLPSLEKITDYKPKIPLRIYSEDGALIGEFGEERRAFVKIDQIPKVMRDAVLAAEDDQFYHHGGIDYMGVARAAVLNFTSGGVKQGASTITMQVARNFYLSPERTFNRKFNEILLTHKIENSLSKDDILQLYLNQIYLGHRSYGFAVAAQTYFDKPLAKITVAEAAMLAGLPKAPSKMNPITNYKRAKLRQEYVLRRMFELKMIDQAQYEIAKQQQLVVGRKALQKLKKTEQIKADYVAEMVRQSIVEKYGEEVAYTAGYKVYTTIRKKDQMAAYYAVRAGVIEYDTRHGYRGPEGFVDLSLGSGEDFYEESLQNYSDQDGLIPALVLQIDSQSLQVYISGVGLVTLEGKALNFARNALSDKTSLKKRIRIGSVIRVKEQGGQNWRVVQVPEVEAAFVSADPKNGQLRALIGGFDFNKNKFNHVTQAWRQPGSSIKPFIYSASLEKGFTPLSIINDAPLEFSATETGGEAWMPKNYDGRYEGPMTMRRALAKSKNLVTIRIMQAIGPQFAQEYLTHFGFDPKKHPAYLTMSLGAGSATPLQMLEGYSVFANGGYRVQPYLIERIEDAQGRVLGKTQPMVAGVNAERVIDARNAFTITSMLRSVVSYGTAVKAKSLGRSDLAGKTGTTSDSIDAWFCGYNPDLVGIAWMGFDQPKSLGSKETGGGAALPMWLGYMKVALAGIEETELIIPEGLIARSTGETSVDYVYEENLYTASPITEYGDESPVSQEVREEIEDQLL